VRNFGSFQNVVTCNTNLPGQTASGCIGLTIRIYRETEKAIFYSPRILRRGQSSVNFLFYIIGLVFSAAEAETSQLVKVHAAALDPTVPSRARWPQTVTDYTSNIPTRRQKFFRLIV